MGLHSPRGLGGCLTTSTLHPRRSSIPTLYRRPCIPDLPTDAPSEGTLRLRPPCISGTAARSCRSAACTLALSTIPSVSTVSTRRWRFLPLSFFAPSYPRTPPTLVVFTDLGIQDPCARLGIATRTYANPFAQDRAQVLPGAVQAP